eukprot:scaffold3806_cov169-Amphora_coffeaeformis.AAC.8
MAILILILLLSEMTTGYVRPISDDEKAATTTMTTTTTTTTAQPSSFSHQRGVWMVLPRNGIKKYPFSCIVEIMCRSVTFRDPGCCRTHRNGEAAAAGFSAERDLKNIRFYSVWK